MRSATKALLLAATLGALGAPARAYAEGFVSPWLGANFATDPGDGRTAFGVTAGGMGAGVIGGEIDVGYSPSFFGTDNVFGSNNVLSVMGNLILGIPIGGTRGAGIRPYGTGGIGLVRSSVDGLLNLSSFTDNNLGFNLGGGVMGFFGDHVGVRGDLRYFRTLNVKDLTPNAFDLDLGGFNFWRTSFGLVIR